MRVCDRAACATSTFLDYIVEAASWCPFLEGTRGGMWCPTEMADDEILALLFRVFWMMLAACCSAVSIALANVKVFSSSRESSTDCCIENQDVNRTARTRSTLTATNNPPRAGALSSDTASTLISKARKLLRKITTEPCGW